MSSREGYRIQRRALVFFPPEDEWYEKEIKISIFTTILINIEHLLYAETPDNANEIQRPKR